MASRDVEWPIMCLFCYDCVSLLKSTPTPVAATIGIILSAYLLNRLHTGSHRLVYLPVVSILLFFFRQETSIKMRSFIAALLAGAALSSAQSTVDSCLVSSLISTFANHPLTKPGRSYEC